MPYPRSTLTQLKAQIAQDIAADLQGSDPLLRFANLTIIGKVLANMLNTVYGYLDWIARQAVPFTAVDEYLQGWAALKNVFLLPATQAGYIVPGQVTFTGQQGADIPAGTTLVRGDGVEFTTVADAQVGASLTAVVPAIANADPTGQTGAFGNTPVGVQMTLGQSIQGVQSTGTVTTAFTGGADIETNDDLRSRMLQAYQEPPQGGANSDYIIWARAVAGVTRAWVAPNGFGAGTVVVYIMLDAVESAFNGFPQGTNGVATAETRGVAATGDQLNVANSIYPKRPSTALVYVVSPIANPVNFTIGGMTNASATLKAAVSKAFAAYFTNNQTLGGTNDISDLEGVLAAVPGAAAGYIISPDNNIVSPTGNLPVLGNIQYD